MKILFVASEASPFAKSGGLGDVGGSLPRVLASMGHEVILVLPKYRMIQDNCKYVADFPILVGSRKETCILRKYENKCDENFSVYFIDNYHYFDRDGLYGYPDDVERFAFFCRAAVDMISLIEFKPDIIHCNDWQTAPVCMIINENYRQYPLYANIATIYTIHNLQYQGRFSRDAMYLYGVGESVFTSDKAEFYGGFNCVKAGIAYADMISTVSPTYSQEIQAGFGQGLEGILSTRSNSLIGILNGISYDEFNPKTDAYIYKNYDLNTLERKKENKFALMDELGLMGGDVPVIGLVSRLTHQKGIDLIIGIMHDLLKNSDVRVVVVGAGDWHYERAFKHMAKNFQGKFFLSLGINNELAQKVYAGCDMFLMPSEFEPCGLSQMIALRYGTIPIVRSTGGLIDTVLDVDDDPEEGVGFRFNDFSFDGLLHSIYRAFDIYYNDNQRWTEIVKRAMSKDYSWSKSAKQYVELYEQAVANRKAWLHA